MCRQPVADERVAGGRPRRVHLVVEYAAVLAPLGPEVDHRAAGLLHTERLARRQRLHAVHLDTALVGRRRQLLPLGARRCGQTG